MKSKMHFEKCLLGAHLGGSLSICLILGHVPRVLGPTHTSCSPLTKRSVSPSPLKFCLLVHSRAFSLSQIINKNQKKYFLKESGSVMHGPELRKGSIQSMTLMPNPEQYWFLILSQPVRHPNLYFFKKQAFTHRPTRTVFQETIQETIRLILLVLLILKWLERTVVCHVETPIPGSPQSFLETHHTSINQGSPMAAIKIQGTTWPPQPNTFITWPCTNETCQLLLQTLSTAGFQVQDNVLIMFINTLRLSQISDPFNRSVK